MKNMVFRVNFPQHVTHVMGFPNAFSPLSLSLSPSPSLSISLSLSLSISLSPISIYISIFLSCFCFVRRQTNISTLTLYISSISCTLILAHIHRSLRSEMPSSSARVLRRGKAKRKQTEKRDKPVSGLSEPSSTALVRYWTVSGPMSRRGGGLPVGLLYEVPL